MADGDEQATRDALMRATMSLVASQGLAGLRVKHIAAEAGVSVAEARRLYGRRTVLVGAALERFVDDEISRCDAIMRSIDDPNVSGEDTVQALIGELERTFARKDGGSIAQMELYLAAARDPFLAEISTRCIRAYQRMTYRALLASGLSEDSAEACARWVVALVDGFGLHGVAMGKDTYLPPDLPLALRSLGRIE
ncbi:TetR/AcrR family transcriptional regulator [Antrihabitans cavernicola]|uniref:TetR/AcrR family transcriptional regulator n=1 Tax=Antrihabitans cavernicola TaxID=2495913 RepID=A0A5A7S585_9NOCA|nr:TetR/AcrR family transcriptional regulator [Spelaeibacter cavernicola]KAA0021338.1 TetR/AcrR family transcriptional regulator [Spelaeibacter cavernicola]